MVLLSESDDLTKTYQRLHKQEKELHRKEQVDVASRAGKKHVPVEPFHTKHKSSFGWRKHPEEIEDVWVGKRLFNHVRVTRDDWDDVVHTEEAHVVMSVDRDGADLYALRLKQIGEDIKADQAGWKLEAKTAIRVVREEDAESLDTTEPTLLFKTRMHCELEGEWIAELPLLKVSNKDWFFLLTGELCHGGWTTELQSKAEQLGRHWYYKGRYWDKPETTHQQAPAPFCKPPKAKKRTGLAGADVLGPKTDKHRVSKPKAPAEAPGVLSTVARLGLPLQKELKISTASASSADQEPSPKSHADSQGCVAKGQVAVGNANSSLLARLLSGQFR